MHWRPIQGGTWHEARLMDISTGGARIRSTPAPVHHILLVAIKIDAGPALVLESELVRIVSQLPDGNFAWAAAFRNVGSADQTRLTRFVFTEAQKYAGGEAAVTGATAAS